MEDSNKELKAQLAEMERKARERSLGGGNTWVVVPNVSLELFFGKMAKTLVWRYCNFIATEGELERIVKDILEMTTSEWSKMEELTVTELKNQIREYTRVYGQCVTHEINEKRNSLQAALKKIYMDKFRKGNEITAKQILYIASRGPKILELDERDFENGAEHQGTNRLTKRYRTRMDLYWDDILSKVGGRTSWTENQRCHGLLSTL